MNTVNFIVDFVTNNVFLLSFWTLSTLLFGFSFGNLIIKTRYLKFVIQKYFGTRNYRYFQILEDNFIWMYLGWLLLFFVTLIFISFVLNDYQFTMIGKVRGGKVFWAVLIFILHWATLHFLVRNMWPNVVRLQGLVSEHFSGYRLPFSGLIDNLWLQSLKDPLSSMRIIVYFADNWISDRTKQYIFLLVIDADNFAKIKAYDRFFNSNYLKPYEIDKMCQILLENKSPQTAYRRILRDREKAERSRKIVRFFLNNSLRFLRFCKVAK